MLFSYAPPPYSLVLELDTLSSDIRPIPHSLPPFPPPNNPIITLEQTQIRFSLWFDCPCLDFILFFSFFPYSIKIKIISSS